MAESTEPPPGGPSSFRCHHCAGPLSKEMETSKWTVPPLIRDSFSMIGSAVGGTTSAFYGFKPCDANHPEVGTWTNVVAFLYWDCWMSILNRKFLWRWDGVHAFAVVVSRCMYLLWVHCRAILAPPVIVFSSGCAGMAGGAVPALAQLASSCYHAVVSSPSLPPSQDDKMQESRTSSTL